MSMTVAEVQAELAELAKEFGPKAEFFSNVYAGLIVLFVYPDGITSDRIIRASSSADDFAPLFVELRAKWAASRERYDAETIRNMAMEIIRITADRGQCDAFALRAGKFSQHDIDAYGERAVVDANAIAAGGPFAIVPSFANAA